MKPKFLDKRNCHALLPMGHGLPILQRLDICLCELNDKPGQYRGLFSKLVEHNKNTIGKRLSSERLLNIQIDIAQGLYPAEKAIKTEVRDRPYPGPAQLHTVIEYENGNAWKTLVPLQYLLKGWGDANAGHQCYVHSISKNVPKKGTVGQLLSCQMSDEDTFYYVGITGRNWLERLGEHMSEMRRGNKRHFYKALRESTGWQHVLYTSSLREINLSKDDAMNWEELHVDSIASDQYGLNMIPGGYKGSQYFYKYSGINTERMTIEERDRAIAEYFRQNPKKGIPNPFMKELWENDEHYEKVNEANPKRLSVKQRKEIRRLHADNVSITEIMKQVGALDERQVKDFLSGKTYKRGAV